MLHAPRADANVATTRSRQALHTDASVCHAYVLRKARKRNMPGRTIRLETPYPGSSRSPLPNAIPQLMLSVLRLFAAGPRFSQHKHMWFASELSMAGMEGLRRLCALHRRIHTARPYSQVSSFSVLQVSYCIVTVVCLNSFGDVCENAVDLMHFHWCPPSRGGLSV